MFTPGAFLIKILTVVLFVVIAYRNRYHLKLNIIKQVSHIPGNSIWYIFANFYIFWGTPEFIWNRFREMNGVFPRIFKLWGGNRVGIFIKHADDLEVFMNVVIGAAVFYQIIEIYYVKKSNKRIAAYKRNH